MKKVVVFMLMLFASTMFAQVSADEVVQPDGTKVELSGSVTEVSDSKINVVETHKDGLVTENNHLVYLPIKFTAFSNAEPTCDVGTLFIDSGSNGTATAYCMIGISPIYAGYRSCAYCGWDIP